MEWCPIKTPLLLLTPFLSFYYFPKHRLRHFLCIFHDAEPAFISTLPIDIQTSPKHFSIIYSTLICRGFEKSAESESCVFQEKTPPFFFYSFVYSFFLFYLEHLSLSAVLPAHSLKATGTAENYIVHKITFSAITENGAKLYSTSPFYKSFC